MPRVLLPDVAELLPSVALNPFAADVDHETDDPEWSARQPGDEDTPRWLPEAALIPGMLHVCSNLLKDVHERLRGWPEFLEQAKNVEALLCNRDLRQLFSWTFIAGTPHEASHGELFATNVPDLYEQRWSSVVEFLRRTRPMLHVMRL
eukprot:5717427-Alexandrium_andersonii.AAC.1